MAYKYAKVDGEVKASAHLNSDGLWAPDSDPAPRIADRYRLLADPFFRSRPPNPFHSTFRVLFATGD